MSINRIISSATKNILPNASKNKLQESLQNPEVRAKVINKLQKSSFEVQPEKPIKLETLSSDTFTPQTVIFERPLEKIETVATEVPFQPASKIKSVVSETPYGSNKIETDNIETPFK